MRVVGVRECESESVKVREQENKAGREGAWGGRHRVGGETQDREAVRNGEKEKECE